MRLRQQGKILTKNSLTMLPDILSTSSLTMIGLQGQSSALQEGLCQNAEWDRSLSATCMTAGARYRFLPRLMCSAKRLTPTGRDRKSTRLNSSHQIISYAVFC